MLLEIDACGSIDHDSDSAVARATVRYHIDRQNRIVSLSDTWRTWAESNGAPHLADGVLGRSLWDFVGDYQTREVYRTLLARVRDGQQVRFPYRCDAPDLRRFMRMTMTSDGEGGVWFDSETLRTEPRPRCWRAPLPPEAPEMLLRACGWCKRVAVDGAWEEIEVAVARLDLFGGPATPALTHGMCPPCYEQFMSALAPPTSA